MTTHFQNIKQFILAVLILVALPAKVDAVSVSLQTSSDVHAKDVFVVDVILNTEEQSVNTVEGEVVISDATQNFEIRDVSVAGSGFTMWPRKPSLSAKGDVIAFTGGVPGGVKGNVVLFKVAVFARNPSELRISPKELIAYANDGKGTPLTVSPIEKVVTVGAPGAGGPQDAWKTIISTDNVAPEPFDITLHQDPFLYNGKKFLSFPAVDGQSGIAYFEVQEGDTLPVRTGDQYVLVNQKGSEPVTVIVYDVAGNTRVGIYTGKVAIRWMLIVLLTLVLCIIRYRKGIIRYINLYVRRNSRKS